MRSGDLQVPKLQVGKDADVVEGQMQRVVTRDLDVLLIRIDGWVQAFEDRCPHMAVPLSMGTLEGRGLTCPLHQGKFDVVTGAILCMPNVPAAANPESPRARLFQMTRTYPLRKFPVEVLEGEVYIDVPG